jgi:hypothetical protein
MCMCKMLGLFGCPENVAVAIYEVNRGWTTNRHIRNGPFL